MKKKNLLICITKNEDAKYLYKIDEVFSKNFNLLYVIEDGADFYIWRVNHNNIEFNKKIKSLPPYTNLNDNELNHPIIFTNCCYDKNFNIWLEYQDRFYKTNTIKELSSDLYFLNYKRQLYIDVVNWAEKILIYPCSYNSIIKFSYGIANNLISSIFVEAVGIKKDVYLVPTMSNGMFLTLQENKNYKTLINNVSCILKTNENIDDQIKLIYNVINENNENFKINLNNAKTNYEKYFGSPEKAANTLEDIAFGKLKICSDLCNFKNSECENSSLLDNYDCCDGIKYFLNSITNEDK